MVDFISKEAKGGLPKLRRHVFVALLISLSLTVCLFSASCVGEKQVGPAEAETVYRESPSILGAARKDAYSRSEGSVPFPVAPPLVILRGTWAGMGEEYGRHVGLEIRHVFEGLYRRLEAAGMTRESLRESIGRCRATLEDLSPRMLDFMEGIAEGSSAELRKSVCGTDLEAMEKILFINFFPYLYQISPGFGGDLEEEGSAWACRGELSSSGEPLVGMNVDATYYPFMYRLAIVVIPDDPDSLIFFTLPVAGSVGGPFGINEKGLFIASLPVKSPPAPGSTPGDLGEHQAGAQPVPLPPTLLSTLALVDSKDVSTSRKALLFGPGDEAAGERRKDLISCMPSNYLISDKGAALVVERDASHYGLVEEETAPNGGCFIACADDFTSRESYNADGDPMGEAMSAFGLSGEDVLSSGVRRESLRWAFMKLNASVDIPWLINNAAGMKYIFDEQGRRSYQLTDGFGEVVSCYESGLTVDRRLQHGEVPYFGTVCSLVANTGSLEIRFELGSPSDWVGPWEHVDLHDYQR